MGSLSEQDKTQYGGTFKVTDGTETLEIGTDGSADVTIKNDSIEQTTGATHNNENIAVASKDSAGKVQPLKSDLLGSVKVNQGNRISTTSFNSRDAATLAADAVFQGVGEDVSEYGRVGVSITTSNATDGVLTMEVSRDNVTWGGPTRTWSDTRFAQPHMWEIVESRKEEPFKNFDDIKKRVKLMPDPHNLMVNRILDEISGMEKHSLFVDR